MRWADNNKLKFNTDKTKYIIFSRKRTVPALNIKLNSVRLTQLDVIRYLGILFDRKLTWNRHIDNVYNQTLQTINRLTIAARVRWGLRSEVLKVIYEAALLPKILYGVHAWSHAVGRKKNLEKLRRLQRLIAIKVCKGFSTLSYEAAILLAGMLPINLIIDEKTELYRIKKLHTNYKNISHDDIELPVTSNYQ